MFCSNESSGLLYPVLTSGSAAKWNKTSTSVRYSSIPSKLPRSYSKKEKLSKIAQSCGVPSKTADSIESALNDIAKENDRAIIFCTGSLYFAGEILNLN